MSSSSLPPLRPRLAPRPRPVASPRPVLLSQPAPLPPAISCAFQPIVDTRSNRACAYEALVRGLAGEGARAVFAQVAPPNLASFDEHCRAVALTHAAQLALDCDLHLNLMPHTVQLATDCLATTMEAARRYRFPLDRLVIEVTEQEVLGNEERFFQLAELYRGHGVRIALDDFGAGYSGLNLLAEFQPDELKLDLAFAQGITRLGPRQAIVRAIVQVCRDLGIDLIAEGIETLEELHWFRDEGVYLFQGYLFARPGFESLPTPHFP